MTTTASSTGQGWRAAAPAILAPAAMGARFDRLARVGARSLRIPFAVIDVLDGDQRRWTGVQGVAGPGAQLALLDQTRAILAHAPVEPVVVDLDHRGAPVIGGAPVRFLAGQVLRDPSGRPLGALWAMDHRRRQLDPGQRADLVDLGALVEEELARERATVVAARLDQSARTQSSILAAVDDGLVLVGPDSGIIDWNPAAERLLGVTGEEMAGRTSFDPRWRTVHGDGTPWPGDTHPSVECLRTGLPVRDQVMGIHRPDGTTVWLQVSAEPTTGMDDERRAVAVFTDITERRALEVALAGSERLARTSLDALEQGVVLIGPDGVVKRANPAATRVVGFTATELTEKWASGEWETYDEDWRPVPPERRMFGRVVAGETVREEIVGWLRKDGEGILLRISCVPDADGEGAFLVAFTDVTDERRMLQDLARFRHLFKHANDIIAVLDASGQVLYASPSSARVLGYPATWRPSSGVLDLVHPDDAAAAAEQLQELVEGTRGPEPFTVRLKTADGEWRHVECVGVNLLHEPSVRGVVLTCRDTTERERLSAQLAHLARHDPLTDLPNRSVLEPRLEEALARSREEGTRVGLCFIDLDRFKQVNDVHGHAVGDSVLVEVAQRILRVTRRRDTAVRMGGDEFVIILDDIADEHQALAVARRVSDALTRPPIVRGHVIVGASMGVALCDALEPPTSLLLRADTALYRAKARRDSSIELAPAPGGPSTTPA